MGATVFSSSSSPTVYVSMSEETKDHLQRHFNSDMPGSKFFFDSPEGLIQAIVDGYPNVLRKTKCNEYGYKIVSVLFPSVIGTCNVVSLDDVTEEELATLHIVQRGETLARCIISKRIIHTKECQLILDGDNNVITAYPGEMAPPLPDTPDIHDDYWDNHVFIEPVKR